MLNGLAGHIYIYINYLALCNEYRVLNAAVKWKFKFYKCLCELDLINL